MQTIPLVSPSSIPVSGLTLKNFSYKARRHIEETLGPKGFDVLENLDYWLTRPNCGVIQDGVRWIYNSVKEIARQTGMGVRTWFDKCRFWRALGIVLSIRRQTDCLYRIDYERLAEWLLSRGVDPFKKTSDRTQECRSDVPSLQIRCAKIAHLTPLESLQDVDSREPKQLPRRITQREQTAGSVSEPPTLDRESGLQVARGSQVPTDSDPTAEGNPEQSQEEQDLVRQAQAIAREVVPLNPTIAGVVRQTVAQLGSAALDKISAAAEVVKSNKARNPAGLFMDALKNGWRPSEPAAIPMVSSSEPPTFDSHPFPIDEPSTQAPAPAPRPGVLSARVLRTGSANADVATNLRPNQPAPAKVPSGWNEWSALAVLAGLDVEVQPDEFGELEVCLNGEWFSPKQAMKMHPLDDLRLMAGKGGDQ